jgi:hypothetical protein
MTRPSPGSSEAIALGCKCPIKDNHHGKGVKLMNIDQWMFWINQTCPVHGDRSMQYQIKNSEDE